MVKLYADEQFPLPVVKILRTLGYDILTVQDAGKAEQKIPDPEVLHYAISLNRAVLTMNRRDFIRLHAQTPTSDLEKAIDDLVYRLYGLTEEEIKIVEGER